MKSRINIDSITNGLIALQRLKQIHNPPKPNENGRISAVHPDKLTLMRDILTTVTDFLPAAREGSFNAAFRLGSHYSGAYRNIKQHVRNMGVYSDKGGMGLPQLLKTIEVVSPVFNSRQKVYVDKIVKIIKILES